MCKLDCLRWHHWQYLSRQGLPKLQGVAVLQGDCGLGVYHHRHRGFDVCTSLPEGSVNSGGAQTKRWSLSLIPCQPTKGIEQVQNQAVQLHARFIAVQGWIYQILHG